MSHPRKPLMDRVETAFYVALAVYGCATLAMIILAVAVGVRESCR